MTPIEPTQSFQQQMDAVDRQSTTNSNGAESPRESGKRKKLWEKVKGMLPGSDKKGDDKSTM